MIPEYTTQPMKCLPAAAAGVSVTPSGTAWANSAWVQLTASTSEAITLFSVTLNPGAAAGFELEIGKGSAGSETVVAIVPGHIESTGSAPMEWVFEFGYLIDNIPAGTRVAVRLRKSGTSVTAWTAKLNYLSQVADVGVTANIGVCTPAAASGTSITPSGTAWANSSWVQLSASMNPGVLHGIVLDPGVAADFEVDIGVGGASSEVVVGTVAGSIASLVGAFPSFKFDVPIQIESTAIRVAFRIRKSDTSTTAWTGKLHSMPLTGFSTRDHYQTTTVQKVMPTAPGSPTDAAVGAGNGTAWANSAWVEHVASTAAAIVVGGFSTYHYSNTAVEIEVELGKGGAGSETVVSTVGQNREGDGPSNNLSLANVSNIAASTRVASRVRKSGTSTANWHRKFSYLELPLAS